MSVINRYLLVTAFKLGRVHVWTIVKVSNQHEPEGSLLNYDHATLVGRNAAVAEIYKYWIDSRSQRFPDLTDSLIHLIAIYERTRIIGDSIAKTCRDRL